MKIEGFQARPKVRWIEVEPYLQKLGVYKELPSLNFLKQLHRYHLMVFPFENLDVHFRRPIVLDIERIYDKIINSNRGGFCYELNLLFYHLLVHLGYECQLVSARVWNRDTEKFGPEYDHMAILTKIREDVYVCDVGFGDGFISPKKLKLNELQMDGNRYFQVFEDPDENVLIKRTGDGIQFTTLYRFALIRREPIEFIDMCDYHQSSPESTFAGRRILTKLTQLGRVTLTDKKLKIEEKGVTESFDIMNDDAFYAKMEEHFGIRYQSLLHD